MSFAKGESRPEVKWTMKEKEDEKISLQKSEPFEENVEVGKWETNDEMLKPIFKALPQRVEVSFFFDFCGKNLLVSCWRVVIVHLYRIFLFWLYSSN